MVSANNCVTPNNNKTWGKPVRASHAAVTTYNPIRAITENSALNVQPNADKPVIKLSLGDPTFYGNMGPAESTVNAVVQAIQSGKYNGYTPAAGLPMAREAIAEYLNSVVSTDTEEALPPNAHQVSADDIYIAHGCSHALDMTFALLCDSSSTTRSNILIPKPGFPLYKTLSTLYNIECREYRLLPERGFEADLEHMASLVDQNTAAIVVTNPGNPSGWVYSRQHLLDLVEVARRFQLPIVADEIYLDFVFSSKKTGANSFIPIGTISEEVPVISCSGISKTYMTPGWRIGWLALYDRAQAFDESIRVGLNALCQRIQAPCSFLQAALPAMLQYAPPREHMDRMISIVERNADIVNEILGATPGIQVVTPQGSMYVMILLKLEAFRNSDVKFASKLIQEQSVYCLPGSVFGCDDAARIVLTLPEDKMREACERIREFCVQHGNNKKVDSVKDMFQAKYCLRKSLSISQRVGGGGGNMATPHVRSHMACRKMNSTGFK